MTEGEAVVVYRPSWPTEVDLVGGVARSWSAGRSVERIGDDNVGRSLDARAHRGEEPMSECIEMLVTDGTAALALGVWAEEDEGDGAGGPCWGAPVSPVMAEEEEEEDFDGDEDDEDWEDDDDDLLDDEDEEFADDDEFGDDDEDMDDDDLVEDEDEEEL